MGSIVAYYYGTSVTDVNTICSRSNVYGIVLNNGIHPTYGSNMNDMVVKAHDYGVKVFGYVDSGGYSSTTTSATGPRSWNSVTLTCDDITRSASLSTANPSPETGSWCHRAYDSTDLNLASTNCYSLYYGSPVRLRKQVRSSTTDACADWFGYMSEHVTLWLAGNPLHSYAGDGIMFDNCFPGPESAANAPTTDSRYLWYKKVCNAVKASYSSAKIILNAGEYPGPEWWFTTGTPFFDFMNISETDYGAHGNTNFPPNSDSSYSPYPMWVTGGTYAGMLTACCINASTMGTSDCSAWYTDCCNNGIKYGYISTDTSGGYLTAPSNISLQNTDAGATSC